MDNLLRDNIIVIRKYMFPISCKDFPMNNKHLLFNTLFSSTCYSSNFCIYSHSQWTKTCLSIHVFYFKKPRHKFEFWGIVVSHFYPWYPYLVDFLLFYFVHLEHCRIKRLRIYSADISWLILAFTENGLLKTNGCSCIFEYD